MGRFSLTITLGNDRMVNADDVIDALQTVETALERSHTAGVVKDANGNPVGAWHLELEPTWTMHEHDDGVYYLELRGERKGPYSLAEGTDELRRLKGGD